MRLSLIRLTGTVTLAAFTALAVAGCKASDLLVPEVKVSLSPSPLSLRVGESGVVTASITGGKTTPSLESCNSSNPSVATTQRSGNTCAVTAIGVGGSTITASAGGKSGTTQVEVSPRPNAITAVTATISNAALRVGDRATITPIPSGLGVGASVSYAYSASPAGSVSIDGAGVVTAVAGSANGTPVTITVNASASGSNFTANTVSTSIPITVTALPDAIDAVAVTPSSGTINVGATLQLNPSATPAGRTVSYAFASDRTDRATVSATGLVSARDVGDVVITVTGTGSGQGFTTVSRTTTARFTIVAPPAFDSVRFETVPTELQNAQAVQIRAIGIPERPGAIVSVTGVESRTPSVIIASVANGQAVLRGATTGTGTSEIFITVTGTGAGYTQVVRTYGPFLVTLRQLQNAFDDVIVNPASLSLPVGSSASVTTTPTPTRAGVAIDRLYQSSSPNVFSVNPSGVVTGLSVGSGTLTITVNGSGSGYNTVSRTVTIPVTVALAAGQCRIQAVDFTSIVSGTLSQGDCTRGGGASTVDYFNAFSASGGSEGRLWRLTATSPNIAALQVAAYADTSVLGIATRSQNNNGVVVADVILPPVGGILGVLTTNGVFGSYQFQAVPTPDDASCRTIMVIPPTNAIQRVGASSCAAGTVRFSEFIVFAQGRGCTIDITRVSGGVVDPIVEVYNANGTVYLAGNDNAFSGTLDARVTMNPCSDPNGSVLTLRVGSTQTNDLGLYRLNVTLVGGTSQEAMSRVRQNAGSTRGRFAIPEARKR